MSRYKLNPKFEKLTTERIFSLLLNSIQINKSYKTLKGEKTHKIIKVEGSVTVERLNASNKPKISFNEFIKVINLFRSGNSYNTSSKEYENILSKPIHKTPLLSILLASDIIIKS